MAKTVLRDIGRTTFKAKSKSFMNHITNIEVTT